MNNATIKNTQKTKNLSELSDLSGCNWSWVKLGDVCEFSQGIQVEIKKQSDKRLKNYVRFLRIIDFTQGKDEPRYVENPGEKYFVHKDDLSMVRYGAVGFICRGLEGVIANNLFRIIPSNNVDKGFLFYFFKAPNFLNELKLNVKGATMPAISFTFVKGLVLPHPPLPEQKKIVEKIEELFSGLDSGVASLKKAKEQLRLYRQSVLAFAFSGRLTASPELVSGTPSGSGYKKLKRVQLDNNGLPEGWKWVKLGEVAKFSQGVQVPVENQKMQSFNGAVRFLRIIDFTQGNQEGRYIINPGEKYKVSRTDLSMVRYGASTGFICRGLEGVIANNLFRILPSDKVNKVNLFYFFKSPYFQEKLESSLKGAAMPAISFNFLNNLIFPLAPLNQQTQIVSEIESHFAGSEALEKEIDDSLEKSESLRQSILKQAFEGRLV